MANPKRDSSEGGGFGELGGRRDGSGPAGNHAFNNIQKTPTERGVYRMRFADLIPLMMKEESTTTTTGRFSFSFEHSFHAKSEMSDAA